MTGGGSAAYGSDAISGVVNFILDTDFEGAKANIQTGMTDRHDHSHYQVEFAAGTSIGERGHLIGSVDYYDADGIIGYEGRDWGAEGWALFTQTSTTAVPRRFYAPDGRSRVITPGGLIPSGPLSPGGAGGIAHSSTACPSDSATATRSSARRKSAAAASI